MTPISPFQSNLSFADQSQTRERGRENQLDQPNKIKKFKSTPLSFESLYFDAVSCICKNQKLHSLYTLGLVSTRVRTNIEKLPVWKKLAQISGLVFQNSTQLLSELSASISDDHPGALKMCASIYLEEKLADQNFERALEYLHRLKSCQENPADQAQIDLDIAKAYVRHSTHNNHLENALQLYSNVMENINLSYTLRVNACFAILRLEAYYDLSAFEDPNEIVDSAFTYFDILPFDHAGKEASLLSCLMQRDWDADSEQDNLLIQEFLEISTSPDSALHVQCEARLQLVFMHCIERSSYLSSKAAFDMAMELINNPSSSPEVACLAKFLAALLANQNEECNLTKDDIFLMWVEVAESGFANRNAHLRMSILDNMFYMTIDQEIDSHNLEHFFQIYSELLGYRNLTLEKRDRILYCFDRL